MAIKPSILPDWATDTENNGSNNTPNKVQPTPTKLLKGWGFPEKPPRGEFNWWMNKVGEWIRHLVGPTYVVTADGSTVTAGSRVGPDNSSAVVTINLPAAPVNGDVVYFKQIKDQLFSTHNLIVGRNGSTIMDLSEDMTVGTGSDNIEFEMAFNGTTWIVSKTKAVGSTAL